MITGRDFSATNQLTVPQLLTNFIYHCAGDAASVTAFVTAPGYEAEKAYPMYRLGTDWQTDDLNLIVLPGEIVKVKFGITQGAV